jgi:amino acid adenylation domain-containing protein/non-ribosomal peptide synthase protein (TIGR01720 family)
MMKNKDLSIKRAALFKERLKQKGMYTARKPDIPRRDDTKLNLLSFAQQRIWFLAQLEPNSTAYNIPYAIQLEGRLSVETLERSIAEVIRRHESLRTTFSMHGNQPVQVITTKGCAHLPLIHLEILPKEEQDAQLQYLSQQEAQAPFRLSTGPLLRTRLLRLSQDQHVLLLTIHHIISDGWSEEILLQELVTLYRAFVENKPSPLPELPIQYADFAQWQRQQLQGEILEKSLRYWREELSGLQPLHLPYDHPRPAVQTLRGAYQKRLLPDLVRDKLKALCREEDVTLFMVLLAAFQVLLSRYTGQGDIAVGTPIASRTQPEIERLIGFFANTLVVHTDLSENPSFLQLLTQTREKMLGAYAHQDVPFEKLVEELHPERDLSRTPLFQTLFVEQRDLPAFEDAAGLHIRPRPLETATAKFDLTFIFMETDQGILSVVEYNTDLFEAATMSRFLEHWQILLEGIVAHPEQSILTLPLLSDTERQQQIIAWNDTTRYYPDTVCIHELFEKQVQLTPDGSAVVFDEHTLTYSELNRQANLLAHELQTYGVGPDVMVGVCMERSLAMVIALLGILKAGGAYVPLDPTYPQERLAYMIEDARVSLMLTQPQIQERLPATSARVICLADENPETTNRDTARTENPASTVQPDHLIYMIYTSGSTGRPKGAMNTHRSLSNRLHWMQQTYGLTAEDRILQKTPFSFDVSVWEFFWPLITGACLVVARPGGHQEPAYMLSLIEQQYITTLHFVPSMLQVFLLEPNLEGCAQLKRVICSGEALSSELQKRFFARLSAELHNLYGPTEAAIDVSSWACERDDQSVIVPIGRPIANIHLYVLDKALQPVPVGVPGELYIGGVGVARGYYNRPDLTAEKFLPDPFSAQTGSKLYRTGDLARYRPDGTLEFLGRLDQQVKIRGQRIELGEIEAALLRLESVQEAVVTLYAEQETTDKRLVAYLVAPPHSTPPNVDALRRELSRQLPDAMLPAHFLWLDRLPLTPNGKLDRAALPAPQSQRPHLDERFIPARNPLETTLTTLWQEVLGLDQIGIHDNFFALGGDSILSIQLVSRAAQVGLSLTPKALFQAQTIAQLADLLSSQTATLAAPHLPKLPTGPVPLTPIQHWFFAQDLPERHHYNQSLLLRGHSPLHLSWLHNALQHVVEQHVSLRLRFALEEHGWQQWEERPAPPLPLHVLDYTGLNQSDRQQAIQQVIIDAQASLHLQRGPLLRALLLQDRRSQPPQLLLVCHHLLIDAVSWRWLLADLEQAYQQLATGAPLSPPPPGPSYAHWAHALVQEAQQPDRQKELSYWLSPQRALVPALPLDHAEGHNNEASSSSIEIALDEQQTDALLHQVPTRYHTRINEVLLTALARAISAWTGTNQVLVDLEGHGREEIAAGLDVSHTLGWFTTLYPLLLDLPANQEIGTVLKAIKEQVRQLPGHGIGYGILRYLHPDEQVRQALAAQPQAQILFNYLGQLDTMQDGLSLMDIVQLGHEAEYSPRGQRSHILNINGMVQQGQLRFTWGYSSQLHERTTIASVANRFRQALLEVIAHCQSEDAGGYTPSDFPLAHLNQQQLDALSPQLPATLEDLYVLTPLQEGLLFHTLIEPGLYLEQFSCHFEGTLAVQSFELAWRQIVERYAILRTAFWWGQGNRALQLVQRQVRPSWHILDWQGLSAEEQDRQLQVLRQQDRERGFDVKQAPLLRFCLIRQSEQHHLFLWSYHHLLLDGWSIPIVLKEVFACYEQLQSGKRAHLEPVNGYRDYIGWLQKQDQQAAERFWQAYMEGMEAPTPLPVAQPASSSDEQRQVATQSLQLSYEETAALQAWARHEQITLNTLLTGAWGVLLSRYSGTEEVIFGTTVAGRPPDLAGVESMVGVFINTLPVRLQVPSQGRVGDWLRQIQTQQAECRQYDYASLAEIQRWCGLPPGQSLFEALLIFDNYPDPRLLSSQQALQMQSVEILEHTNYPLNLRGVLLGESLELSIMHDATRFLSTTITQMLGHLRQLLKAMTIDAKQQVADLSMLTERERYRMLVQWNDTKVDYPENLCLHQLFEEQVQVTPDAIAIIAGNEKITYTALNQRANQLAHYLQRQGVGSDTLVGLYTKRSIDMLVGAFGILKAGGAYVPLEHTHPQERLAFMLEDAAISLLLTQEQLLEKLPPIDAHIVCLDRDSDRIAQESTEQPEKRSSSESLAYVIYTSGSTGRPKGAMVPHKGIVNYLKWSSSAYNTAAGAGTLVHSSLSFDLTLTDCFAPLLVGLPVTLLSDEVRDIEALGNAIQNSNQLSHVKLTPSHFDVLRHMLPPDNIQGRTKAFITGGEPLHGEALLFWRTHAPDTRLINEYGPTETVVGSTMYEVAATTSLSGVLPIGRPIANVLHYVLDQNLQPVPVGVPGELYIGGVCLARGYYNRPELTAERFVPHPFSDIAGERLYRTGDLVRYRSDGILEFVGRTDHQVKIHGYRIELGEIEAALAQFPEVLEVAVIVREDMPGEKRLVAYMVVREQMIPPTTETLRTHLQRRLPDYMIPTGFIWLERLPLTANGKIDWRALPAPESSRPELEEAFVAPRTATEKALASIWEQVLRLEAVGIHDNFFTLGGDSILSIQIVSRAAQAGLMLSPRHLFQHQTIAQLAQVLQDTPTRTRPSDASHPQGEVSLTPIQQWFFAQQLPAPHHYNQSLLLSLQEPLACASFLTAFQAVTQHHDSLRLRYEQREGVWRQYYAEPIKEEVPFQHIDLSALSQASQRQEQERIAADTQARLDLSLGPLLRAVSFTSTQASQLLLVCHHLVIDGISWRILLSDLQQAYEQVRQKEAVRLLPTTTSYQRWAEVLQRYAHSPQSQQEQEYWLRPLPIHKATIPLDWEGGSNREADSRVIETRLSEEQTKALLQKVPGAYHTQIMDVLLTALVQTMTHWTGETGILVDLEGHGREQLEDGEDVSRTLGWFTSLYPVWLELETGEDIGATLKRIKEQIREIPQKGIGYGILRYLHTDEKVREELGKQGKAHISMNYLGQFDSTLEETALFRVSEGARGAERSPEGTRSHMLTIDALVVDGCLQIQWDYSAGLHKEKTIKALAQSYQHALEELIMHCCSEHAGGYTPSDFPLARLNQQQLDELLPSLPRALEDLYALTPLQEGLLFHTLIEPGLYLEQMRCRFEGALAVQSFELAWRQVIERHAILRTTFWWEEGDRPLQLVHQQIPFHWKVLDWQRLSTEEQERQIHLLQQQDRNRGFDVKVAPLQRFTLIRLREQEHLFMWSHHHLLLDGWSVSQLLKEVFACYESLQSGGRLHLEMSRYRDYIAWLQQRDQTQAERFWRRYLADLREPTPLPVAPTAHYQSGSRQVATQRLRLSYEETTALQSWVRGEQVTINTLLLGAWAVLLSRYSGNQEVIFGTTVAGRPADLPGIDTMVGLFINTLPVRIQIAQEVTVGDWLRRIQAQQVECRDYAYAALAEIQRWSEFSPGQGLFETLLIFENYPVDSSVLKPTQKLSIHDIHIIEQTNYPLVIQGSFEQEHLDLLVTYASTTFHPTMINRLLEHLRTLLTSMISGSMTQVIDLDMLSEVERQQQLIEWNQTQLAYPSEHCLHTLIEQQARRSPDAIALVYENEHITYQCLNQHANKLARYLRRLGVGSGVLVGLIMERSIEMLIGLLGVLKAGGAYIPLDPSYPQERVAFALEDAQAPLVLAQQQWSAPLPPCVQHIVYLDRDWTSIMQEQGDNLLHREDSHNLAYVIYTSGSTGRPKGVQISHAPVVNFVTTICHQPGFSARDTIVAVTTLSFDIAVLELLLPLCVGARIVVANQAVISDGEQLGALLEQAGATIMQATPTTWQLLLTTGWLGKRNLKMLCGGEGLPQELANQLLERGAELWNMYGPTETTIWSSCHRVNRSEQQALAPIGRPIANTQMYLLDARMGPVPPGVPGELYIGGEGLATGYNNQPALTAERFVPNPFSQIPGARLYRTGDLARYQEDGVIEFLGRNDYQVKVHGYRIELGEIEAALLHHESIQSCVVTVHEGVAGDKRLVAYMVGKEREKIPTVSMLRDYLHEHLPEYMLPASFLWLDQLPLTPNGKVDRAALPAPEGLRPEMEEAFVAPRTALEAKLASIWQQVLEVNQVGIHDNFFVLGGDSIRSIRIVSLAKRQGLILSLQHLFQYPTIFLLVQHVFHDEMRSQLTEPTLPLSLLTAQDCSRLPAEVEDAYPLTMLQAGMLFHSQYTPDDTAIYHDIVSSHIRAPFVFACLQRAFQHMQGRHPILRTSFDLANFRIPMQLVHRSVSLPLLVEDLRILPVHEQEQVLDSWFESEKRRAFALDQPLLRLQVHWRSEETFQLTLSFHHAILDGWSVASLLAELLQDYLAEIAGSPLRISPPAATFRDFVAHEQHSLASEETRRYWRDTLQEYTQMQLPRWQVQPSEKLHTDVPPVTTPLGAALVERLKYVANTCGVPLKSVLLAAHLRVLHLLSGQGDCITGLVVNGRPEINDGERVLGMFLNTVPLRVQLTGGSWQDLIQATFAAERDLLPHRWYPQAQMQKEQGGKALFETAFNFDHFHVYQNLMHKSQLQVLEERSFGTTNFTLAANFNLEASSNQLQLQLLADATILPREQVEIIATYYVNALTAIANQPRAPYEKQDLMTERELERILVEWNQTEAVLPEQKTLHHLFEQQAQQTPDAIALHLQNDQLTYSELDQRTNQIAHFLKQMGVGPEVRVGLCMERSLEIVIGILGVLKAGGAYVPFDPTYPPERIAFMLDDARVQILLMQQHLSERLPTQPERVVCLDRDWSTQIAPCSREPLHIPQSVQHLAYVIYTSGSTGRPKGVEVTHQGISNLRRAMQTTFGLDQQSRVLQFASFNFDASVFELVGALLSGATLCLAPENKLLPGLDLLHVLQEQAITMMTITPSALAVVPADDTLALRTLIVVGEACSADLVARWSPGRQFFNAYGPTETTIWATVERCYPSQQPPAIGKPISNFQLYVLTPDLRPVPVGVAGELCIGCSGLARGYLYRPDLTAERFIPHPFSTEPGRRLYRTGDLARYRPDGTLEFLGRLDQQVKIRGQRIELGEIEAALLRLESVQEAVVTLYAEQETTDKRLVAYLVAPPRSTPPNVDALRRELSRQLPDAMLPAHFLWLDRLPLTPNGKLDRAALPAPHALRPQLEEAFVPAQTALQSRLVDLWQEVLGLDQIGIHDNFFALGGDSILSIQLVSRAAQSGLSLSPKALFQTQTIAQLAELMLTQTPSQVSSEPDLPDGPVPLTPIQHWFFAQNLPERHHYNQSLLLQIRSQLHLPWLQEALSHLVHEHASLRLRFASTRDGWQQWVEQEHEAIPLLCLDFSSLSGSQKQQAMQRVIAESQASLQLQQGPLLRVLLLWEQGPQHAPLLLLVCHHLLIDAVSWRWLLADLEQTYQQLASGEQLHPATPDTSYQRWAYALEQDANQPSRPEELTYWLAPQRARVASLPLDHALVANIEADSHSIEVELDEQQTAALLHQVPALYRTQINEVLLTGLALALSEWTGTSQVLVDLEGHGREDLEASLDVSRAIGWFTTFYPVLLDLPLNREMGTVLKAIKEQMRQIPRRGIGYGILRYLHPDEQVRHALAAQPQAQVLFNYFGQFDTMLEEDSLFDMSPISIEPQVSPHGQRSHLLSINGMVVEGRLRFWWQYSSQLHERVTIAGIANRFRQALLDVIAHCQSEEAGGYTPSDFPLAGLDQQQLDNILRGL